METAVLAHPRIQLCNAWSSMLFFRTRTILDIHAKPLTDELGHRIGHVSATAIASTPEHQYEARMDSAQPKQEHEVHRDIQD
ncbi:hypothetical protein Scep_023802 [Stephania cephalantha]|uniref:Uncharacterized protein n=1 Tax=Stephania cephalantha TaxID=152367 RepID=A0AAP0EY96_9MAGN